MVKDTGKARSLGSLRPLNIPTLVHVQTDSKGCPVAVVRRGIRSRVFSTDDHWRIEDEWWRDKPIIRNYYAVTLVTGRRVTLYQDSVTSKWYEQRDG